MPKIKLKREQVMKRLRFSVGGFVGKGTSPTTSVYIYTIAHWPDIFALLTSEPVSFPEQTLSSGTEVFQPPIQKYGTVCRLHSDSLA